MNLCGFSFETKPPENIFSNLEKNSNHMFLLTLLRVASSLFESEICEKLQ